MTFKLILENLRHRPLRTLLSVLLIAIPVTLILTLVGLSRGMLDESAKRTRSVGADILVRPPNSSLLSFSAASIPQHLVNRLEQVPHVKAAVGTVIAPVSGLLSVTGLDLPAFERVSGGFEFVEGGPFKNPGEILVSRVVHDLVSGSGLRTSERGTHRLKGLDGDWSLFGVED